MDAMGGWEIRERAQQMLEQVGLPDTGMLVGSMSGGQKRRLALAAALLSQPDLLVADEPTNAMDYQARYGTGIFARTTQHSLSCSHHLKASCFTSCPMR
jgi:ATP-binding cassette subfamily F protein uup